MSELIINITDTVKADIKVIAIIGEMDEVSLETLQNKIQPTLDNLDIKTIIFDLSQLEFINSKGIGYFVSVHTHLAKTQRKMILAAADEAVMDVISLVGLTTIIKYFGTVEEALNNL